MNQAVDAGKVVDQLIVQVAQLAKENAILRVQLSEALNVKSKPAEEINANK